MQTCEQLLNESLKTYREIGHCYDSILKKSLNDRNLNKIEQQTKLIDIFSQQAQEIDGQLQSILPPTSKQNNKIKKLIRTRKEQLQILLDQNNQIAKRAGNAASLLKHEFSNLAQNNSVITQYGQVIPNQRKSIFNTSY